MYAKGMTTRDITEHLQRVYGVDASPTMISKMTDKILPIANGIKLDGTKKIMGMWIGGNESAKYWLGVLNEIKNRGTEDILIVSVDGLTGFGDAIHAVFPDAEIQRCIVHQIRYSTRFVSYKDIKPFMADLKLVYQAATEDIALQQLEALG